MFTGSMLYIAESNTVDLSLCKAVEQVMLLIEEVWPITETACNNQKTAYVTQSEKTGLIAHVSRFDFSPRTHSYMNKLSNSTFKIS